MQLEVCRLVVGAVLISRSTGSIDSVKALSFCDYISIETLYGVIRLMKFFDVQA